MRLTTFFLVLLCAVAWAESPVPADRVAKVDLVELQLAEAQHDALAAKLELARRDLEQLAKKRDAAHAFFQSKYQLKQGDRFDEPSMTITRAKPPVPVPPATKK